MPPPPADECGELGAILKWRPKWKEKEGTAKVNEFYRGCMDPLLSIVAKCTRGRWVIKMKKNIRTSYKFKPRPSANSRVSHANLDYTFLTSSRTCHSAVISLICLLTVWYLIAGLILYCRVFPTYGYHITKYFVTQSSMGANISSHRELKRIFLLVFVLQVDHWADRGYIIQGVLSTVGSPEKGALLMGLVLRWKWT